VTENEALADLIGDPATAAMVLYTEGLSDPQRFLALAEDAREARKPMVVVKAGRSEAGRQAVLSHTASLAGPYRLFAAAARARGAILANDPEVAVTIADALLRWPGGLPRSRGIAAASGSGGGAAVLVDRLEDAALGLATLGEATRARLAAELPVGQPVLPLDAGALNNGFAAPAVTAMLETLTDDPGVGALVYLMTTQPQSEELADAIALLGDRAGKPILLVVSAGSVADTLRARLRKARFVWHERLDDAMRVLHALAEQATPDEPSPVAASMGAPTMDLPNGPLKSSQARTLVEIAGIPVVDEVIVSSPADAVDAATRFGWPIVLKAMVRNLSHKSDRGAVRLDVRDRDAVQAIMADFQAQFGADLDGVLVQPQITGLAELIVGTVWDDAFGPFVLVGAGGVFAELHRDTRLAPAPVTHAQAEALLAGLRLWPILTGVRGRPSADVTGAAAAIVAASRLAVSLGGRLAELDINPLIVNADGVMAVDVRARLGRVLKGEAL
jgi:acetyl-CoA synthetase (ADP-forming)